MSPESKKALQDAIKALEIVGPYLEAARQRIVSATHGSLPGDAFEVVTSLLERIDELSVDQAISDLGDLVA